MLPVSLVKHLPWRSEFEEGHAPSFKRGLTVNRETHGSGRFLGIFTFYRLDSYIDVGPAVSLLRYAKGDGGLPDYAPDFPPQLLGAR